MHDLVRHAQQAGFDAVRPGIACQEIDRVPRGVITEAGYGEYFIHRTGHGIGLTTHEPPYMVEGEEHLIEPGMCFSIEPGIYLTGRFGVRIEDIVTVTENGGRRLNSTPHSCTSCSRNAHQDAPTRRAPPGSRSSWSLRAVRGDRRVVGQVGAWRRALTRTRRAGMAQPNR